MTQYAHIHYLPTSLSLLENSPYHPNWRIKNPHIGSFTYDSTTPNRKTKFSESYKMHFAGLVEKEQICFIEKFLNSWLKLYLSKFLAMLSRHSAIVQYGS